jgi:IMP dehydrogenase/GMP reductase
VLAGLAAEAGAAALPALSFDNVVTTPAALKVDTDQVECGRPFRR